MIDNGATVKVSMTSIVTAQNYKNIRKYRADSFCPLASINQLAMGWMAEGSEFQSLVRAGFLSSSFCPDQFCFTG